MKILDGDSGFYRLEMVRYMNRGGYEDGEVDTDGNGGMDRG